MDEQDMSNQKNPESDPAPDRPSGSLRAFLQEIYGIWIGERPTYFAAALAYYAIFSFVPAIYVAFVLADLFVARLSVSEWFYEEATDVLGAELALYLEEAVANVAERTAGGTTISTLIGFVILVFTASLIFFQLQLVLNRLWGVPPPAKGQTRALVRDRLLAFAMMFAVGPLFVLVAVLDLVLSTLDSLLNLPGSLPAISFGVTLGLGTLVFALLYKVLPNARIAWRDVWPGAVVTALPITLLVSLASLLLSTSKVRSALEAAGAMAVFLLIFYVVGQVIVLGALFTRVYARMFGSQIRPRGVLADESLPTT
jgi:membrane protein